MIKKDIKITDISLWDENPRFPEEYFNNTEKELIQYLFNKKGEKQKIIDLAKSMIKNFDLIPWEDLIIWNTKKQKISLEGNRRVMIYKLLLDPTILDDEKTRKIFEDGKIETNISNGFTINCLETTDKELGLRYVEIKHLEPGYKRWGGSETANFQRRRGKNGDAIILKTEIHKIVRTLGIPEEIKDKVLGHGFVSTFDRLLTDQVAKKHFGLEIKNEQLFIKDKKFAEKLKVIIWNLVNKKSYNELFLEQKDGEKNTLNSRTLNKSDNREIYLNSINKVIIDKASKEIAGSVKVEKNLLGEKVRTVETKQGKIITNPKSTSRNTLIPNNKPTCSLKINQDKINLIFRELREDLFLDKTPNAIGVLFRVFLESTIDFYAEKEGITFKKDNKLKGKITIVADHLEKTHKVTKTSLRNIRKVATNNPSILSIQNFHEYVHAIKVIPKPMDLILKWDELQPFFEIVYNQILKNKS
jgi:hypothetical protein